MSGRLAGFATLAECYKTTAWCKFLVNQMDRVKRIWYLMPMRAEKVQAILRIHTVSPEPSLLANTSSESRGTFRQKARSLAPLNGWAWGVKICHDGMLEDTNSLDGAQLKCNQLNTENWNFNNVRMELAIVSVTSTKILCFPIMHLPVFSPRGVGGGGITFENLGSNSLPRSHKCVSKIPSTCLKIYT